MIKVNAMPRDRASLLNLQVANEPVNEIDADDTDAASPPHSTPLSSRVGEARD